MKRSAVVVGDVPVAVVTRTSWAPTVPAGVVAWQLVEELQDTAVSFFPPSVIELTLTKFVPVIVVRVPPLWLPEFGLILVTVGAGVTPVPVTGMVSVPKAVSNVMCAVMAPKVCGW